MTKKTPADPEQEATIERAIKKKQRDFASAWTAKLPMLATPPVDATPEDWETYGVTVRRKLEHFLEENPTTLDVWVISITPDVDMDGPFMFSRTYSYAFLEEALAKPGPSALEMFEEQKNSRAAHTNPLLKWVKKNKHLHVAYERSRDFKSLDKTKFRVVKTVDIRCGENDF